MRHHISQQRLATAGGICAILFWSLTIALARRISEQIGPISGATCVYAVSALFGVVGILRSRENRQEITQLPYAYLIGCGFLFVSYMLLLFLAVGVADNRSQVLEVGLVNYLWPALTLILAIPILGHKATWMLFPGTVLALSGVFLVLTSDGSVAWFSLIDNLAANPAAYLLALAAAFCWALYSTLTRKWAGDKGSGAVVVFLTITALTLFLICLLVEEQRAWNTRVTLEIIVLGTVTFIAYSLWDYAMRKGNIVLVASCSYLTPLFSTIVACIYLVVVPTVQLWIGCVILIAGSMLSWFSIDDKE